MSKPDDIPQDVWDEAESVGEAVYGRHERGWVRWPLVDAETLRPAISRAIMAAEKRGEERERAACELIAQDWTGGAEYIAAAIRKRGA